MGMTSKIDKKKFLFLNIQQGKLVQWHSTTV
ncbi:hypothetical protein T4A_14426 [Trichinella pseudospiralis]|uniref:Uncharacterized protein n=1 Tax=Trichinella pseudospiralis TaxID=6337 RepID=A0A0V1AHX0_TRIPS|nr:hypothetical protein T4A_14426 [Trichinella pseudospiralis]